MHDRKRNTFQGVSVSWVEEIHGTDFRSKRILSFELSTILLIVLQLKSVNLSELPVQLRGVELSLAAASSSWEREM